jgi:rhodanese-related sulfurtransferase
MRITRLILVITLCVVVGLVLSACSSKVGTAPKGDEVEIEAAAIQVAMGRTKAYQYADTEQMKNWMDLGEIMTLIDIRPEADYLKGHLTGAVNAQIDDEEESSTEQIEAFLSLLPDNKESLVIVYDGYTGLNAGHRAALYASEAEYTNIYRYVGGVAAWTDAGNKLTKK